MPLLPSDCIKGGGADRPESNILSRGYFRAISQIRIVQKAIQLCRHSETKGPTVDAGEKRRLAGPTMVETRSRTRSCAKALAAALAQAVIASAAEALKSRTRVGLSRRLITVIDRGITCLATFDVNFRQCARLAASTKGRRARAGRRTGCARVQEFKHEEWVISMFRLTSRLTAATAISLMALTLTACSDSSDQSTQASDAPAATVAPETAQAPEVSREVTGSTAAAAVEAPQADGDVDMAKVLEPGPLKDMALAKEDAPSGNHRSNTCR